MSLLLFSNSTMAGAPYLRWTRPWLDPFLAHADPILFVPYAAVDITWDEYTARVNQGLEINRIVGMHMIEDKAAAIAEAGCILVGGGNTFCLLHECQRAGILEPIRRAVEKGANYAGWSAGANLACPTIKTTNDMPIVAPEGFDALGLIPFQINPHFIAGKPEGHAGESREQRLAEFLLRNPELPVLGMPEGSLLIVEDGNITLAGAAATWFSHGHNPVHCPPGPVPEV